MSPDSGDSRFADIQVPSTGEFVTKTGAVIPVSVEWLEDGRYIAKAIGDAWDRYLHPWAYPDAPAWPELDLFPRVRRARIHAHNAATRLRDAWQVLRGHETIYDPEDDEW